MVVLVSSWLVNSWHLCSSLQDAQGCLWMVGHYTQSLEASESFAWLNKEG